MLHIVLSALFCGSEATLLTALGCFVIVCHIYFLDFLVLVCLTVYCETLFFKAGGSNALIKEFKLKVNNTDGLN